MDLSERNVNAEHVGSVGPVSRGHRSRWLRSCAVGLVAVTSALATAAPGHAAPTTGQPKEPYRLTPIGRSSMAPPEDRVFRATAPAVLYGSGINHYRVWRAGSTYALAQPTAGLVRFGQRPINGLGEVVAIVEPDAVSPDPLFSRLTLWTPDGKATPLPPVESRGLRMIGLLTDSGSSLVLNKTSLGPFTATRVNPDGSTVEAVNDAGDCTIADMSENGVLVGACQAPTDRGSSFLLRGMSVTLDVPQRPIEKYWPTCRLSQVSPLARYVVGICQFVPYSDTLPDSERNVVEGLWSTDNGKMVANLPPGAIDVDDKGRVLIEREPGVVSLWANGKGTLLTKLAPLAKNQSLLYPRFDAKNQLLAILSTTKEEKTTWQAVRFTPSRTTPSH